MKEFTVKLTDTEIASIIEMVSERKRFFANQLKKSGTNFVYYDFCLERFSYYDHIIKTLTEAIQNELAR